MKTNWFQARLRWFLGKELYAKASWLENWAAALSFYNLTCQVPLFIVLITLAGIFLNQESAASVRDALIQMLPVNSKGNSDEILDGLRHVSSRGFMTIAFLAAVWTCTNFMNQMLKALHFIMGGTWDAWSGAWNRRVKSFFLLLIWIGKMFLNGVSILMMSFISASLAHFELVGFFATPLIMVIHLFLLLILNFVTFYLTYRLASARQVPIGLLCQGAAMAAIGWVAVRGVFLKLLPLAWQNGMLAGTITSMMALLLLAYCVAWVILLGACWIARNPEYQNAPLKVR